MKTFREALQRNDTTITTELTLRRDSGARDVASQVDLFRGKADGIFVTDNPLAWVNMSAVAASSLLLKNGMDPIPILTCRDRNRIALQSDLLGLRALGVSSLLLMRGRRVPRKHALHASTVFDLGGLELIAMANAMNEEVDGQAPSFLIGTGTRVHRPKAGWQAETLQKRARAGAQFVLSQLCYNKQILRSYMDRLIQARATWQFSVIVSLTPFPSADTARWMKDQMSDTKIPLGIIKRLEQAKDPELAGVRICAEAMQEISEIPGVSGIHLMSTGNPELLSAAIDASGLARKPAGGDT